MESHFNLLWVFAESLCNWDVFSSESPAEVLWGGFSRDALFGFEPAVDLYSDPVEAAGTLVNDAEAAVAVVAKARRQEAQAVVVADSILELVNLGDLGLQFPLDML